MSKPFIVIGDKTSHGGTVVGGCTTATTHGKQIARVGDNVTCPRCGNNTIATGDNTMIVMGQPVARDGDKTACGATLISSQSVTLVNYGGSAGGFAASFADVFLAPAAAMSESAIDSSQASSTTGKPRTTYQYKPISREYKIGQPAYLLVKGKGISGSYELHGHIALDGSTLTVSASGSTPASGKVHFSGGATVSKQGAVIASQNFSTNERSYWPNDGSEHIGSVTINLPVPTDLTQLQLKISGGYIYTAADGSAVPVPATTSQTFPIEVEERDED